jgi:hypothetical protein
MDLHGLLQGYFAFYFLFNMWNNNMESIPALPSILGLMAITNKSLEPGM